MRFKKLRIVLAITIVLFILIVANTIIFGLIQEKVQTTVDNKSSRVINVVTNDNSSKDVNPNKTTQNKSENTNNSPTYTQPKPVINTPTPTVTHTRRTRAS